MPSLREVIARMFFESHSFFKRYYVRAAWSVYLFLRRFLCLYLSVQYWSASLWAWVEPSYCLDTCTEYSQTTKRTQTLSRFHYHRTHPVHKQTFYSALSAKSGLAARKSVTLGLHAQTSWARCCSWRSCAAVEFQQRSVVYCDYLLSEFVWFCISFKFLKILLSLHDIHFRPC